MVIISQPRSLEKWLSLMTWSFIALPTPSSVPTENRKVDWERIKRCLAEIDKNSRTRLAGKTEHPIAKYLAGQ